ncbi:M15 family metallopeptidase [Stenotrophomonas maltophilia]|uniref:M15 family metallopeptidase n=1 Tax=Stenotrophomonas maltophilia TaxID=40324 RepID=UPI0009B27C45|nr:M15 family metallopeptidase [Stenotrophomonas maltophilia]
MRKLLLSLLILLAPSTVLATQQSYLEQLTSSKFLMSPSTAQVRIFDQGSSGIIFGSSSPLFYGEIVSDSNSNQAEKLKPTKKPRGRIYRFFHPAQERVWKGVHPDLREKIEAIQDVMRDEGFDLRPVEGYRSPERQAVLLASASGVTSVGAWSSCHNYGLALDAAIYVGGKPSWNLSDPHVIAGYERFGELAEILGLNWGGRWTSPKDYPHVEMKAECGQSKWAKRHGQTLPKFIASAGEPSSLVLERALVSTWCPMGLEATCIAMGKERFALWGWTVQRQSRACMAALDVYRYYFS